MAIARPAHRVKTACTYDDGTSKWVLGDAVATYQDVDAVYAEAEVFPAWILNDDATAWACGPASWAVSGDDHVLTLHETIASSGTFADEDACTVSCGPMPATILLSAAGAVNASIATGSGEIVDTWTYQFDQWDHWDAGGYYNIPDWAAAARVCVTVKPLSMADATEYTVTLAWGDAPSETRTAGPTEIVTLLVPIVFVTPDHYKVQINLAHNATGSCTFGVSHTIEYYPGTT